jgi:isocitrate/isopropylmalate dehydrogenase
LFLEAVERVIVMGEVRTPDLGGKATTAQFTDAVVAETG